MAQIVHEGTSVLEIVGRQSSSPPLLRWAGSKKRQFNNIKKFFRTRSILTLSHLPDQRRFFLNCAQETQK
jgi:hypothetical protein